jgi:hypothetical protein
MEAVITQGDKVSDLIRRCRTMLAYGKTGKDVYDLCVKEGLGGDEAFLVFMSARQLLKSEEEQ